MLLYYKDINNLFSRTPTLEKAELAIFNMLDSENKTWRRLLTVKPNSAAKPIRRFSYEINGVFRSENTEVLK